MATAQTPRWWGSLILGMEERSPWLSDVGFFLTIEFNKNWMESLKTVQDFHEAQVEHGGLERVMSYTRRLRQRPQWIGASTMEITIV